METTQQPPGSAQPAFTPANDDADQLRLLAIFYYVCAALTALLSSLFIVHVVVGIGMMQGHESFPQRPNNGGRQPFPGMDTRSMGLMFATMGAVVVLSGWSFAACLVIAGRKLATHRGRTFCLIIAAIACTFVPLGTILGVFTILVLVRPSVQALFDRSQANPQERSP